MFCLFSDTLYLVIFGLRIRRSSLMKQLSHSFTFGGLNFIGANAGVIYCIVFVRSGGSKFCPFKLTKQGKSRFLPRVAGYSLDALNQWLSHDGQWGNKTEKVRYAFLNLAMGFPLAHMAIYCQWWMLGILVAVLFSDKPSPSTGFSRRNQLNVILVIHEQGSVFCGDHCSNLMRCSVKLGQDG